MTKREFIVSAMQVDANHNLRLADALEMYQDVAVLNVEELGVGMNKILHDFGYMWVVTRMYMECYGTANNEDKVEVFTYPSEIRGGFAFQRQSGINDKDGKPLFRICSTWILMDHDTHRMVLRPQLPYYAEKHEDQTPEPGKVVSEPAELAYSRVVRYSDTDINNHLNNVKYIDLIVDLFDVEFFKTNIISSMLMNYEKEVRCGERIDIYCSKDKTFVEGRVGNDIVFKCKMTFKENA